MNTDDELDKLSLLQVYALVCRLQNDVLPAIRNLDDGERDNPEIPGDSIVVKEIRDDYHISRKALDTLNDAFVKVIPLIQERIQEKEDNKQQLPVGTPSLDP